MATRMSKKAAFSIEDKTAVPPDCPVLQPGGACPADEFQDSKTPTPDDLVRDRKINVLLTSHHTLSEQIAELALAQQGVNTRLKDGDAKMTLLAQELAKNTEVTTEVRDLVTAFKGGFKIAGWFGTGLKWIAGIAAAFLSIYTAFYAVTHGGKLPGQ